MPKDISKASAGSEENRASSSSHGEKESLLKEANDLESNCSTEKVSVEGTCQGESSHLTTSDVKAECRICQEEDDTGNLDSPCSCDGSLKFAHKKCIQRWCNEKGNVSCEICNQPYQGSYSVVPRRQLLRPEEIPLDLRNELAIPLGNGTSRSLLPPDSRVYAVREGEQVYLEVEYDEYDANHSVAAKWCRAVALMVLSVLLLRHALSPIGGPTDDDSPDIFTIIIFRTIGILVPCYIMARAVTLLHRSRVENSFLENPNSIVSADGSTVTIAIHPRSPLLAEAQEQPAPNAPLVQNQA